MTSHAHPLTTKPSVHAHTTHPPPKQGWPPPGHLRGLLPKCPTPTHHTCHHTPTCQVSPSQDKYEPAGWSPPFACMQPKSGSTPLFKHECPYLPQYSTDSSDFKSHVLLLRRGCRTGGDGPSFAGPERRFACRSSFWSVRYAGHHPTSPKLAPLGPPPRACTHAQPLVGRS